MYAIDETGSLADFEVSHNVWLTQEYLNDPISLRPFI